MNKFFASIFLFICLVILCIADIQLCNSQSSDVYLTNASYKVINGASQVTLVSCTNITVTNAHGKILLIDTNYSKIFGNTITGVAGESPLNWEACVMLLRSNHNDIYENDLSNSTRGVIVYTDDPNTGKHSGSRYNNIHGNKISDSAMGIDCQTGGSNTTIYENIITNCNTGIELGYSNQNGVFRNTIKDCRYAVFLYGGSDYNAFYNNNFLSTNVFEDHQSLPNLYNLYPANNTWDAGYPKGGNYWSTYNGTDKDGDGIGDLPFSVYEKYVDRYPLVNTVTIPLFPDETNNIPETPDTTNNNGAGKTEPFPTTLVITASGASLAVVATGLLVYSKKRKRGQTT